MRDGQGTWNPGQTKMRMIVQNRFHPIVIADTLDTCYDQKHLASSLLMTSWQWASFICCCIASGHLIAPPIKANLFAIQTSISCTWPLNIWNSSSCNMLKTYPNLSKLVQACQIVSKSYPELSKLDCMCLNRSKHFKTCPHLSRLVQTSLELVWSCSK